MNTATATPPVPVIGIIGKLARKRDMDPRAFEATLRGTVFPAEGTKEQFAAFCQIADRYSLDPWIKQIYAYLDEKNRLVTIVGVDGWVRILQDNEDYDGMQFEYLKNDKGIIDAITCRIYRRGKTYSTEVTEYLEECKRGTTQWGKYPIRMLRHKALIQCIRYAYGVAGIVDDDEYERIIETQREEIAQNPAPVSAVKSLKARLQERAVIDVPQEEQSAPTPEQEPPEEPPPAEPEPPIDYEAMEIGFREEVEVAKSPADVEFAMMTLEKAKHPNTQELRKVAAAKLAQLRGKK